MSDHLGIFFLLAFTRNKLLVYIASHILALHDPLHGNFQVNFCRDEFVDVH